ncbi:MULTISPECIES: hypothetical protein [unclassified Pseudomonas]|uniref:hypothetical protein n=1 Tax=unclassified Pseudomonas TaxID=196821 RepID=UPI0025EBE3FC|nr:MULTISPECIES: hypothetical protein [unclassified Pseudomonas]
MRGAVLPVWSRTWREVWSPLARHASAPADLFCELYRALLPALKTPPSMAVLAEIIDDPPLARRAFRRINASALIDEPALLAFLQNAHAVLNDLAGEALANAYFNRLEHFITTYNLRYELRRPCRLYPTLPGLFAGMVQGLRDTHAEHPHLHTLQRDFDDAFRDLHDKGGEGRIKTCLQKHINLLEALGRVHPQVDEYALSSICDQLPHWPHIKVRQSLKNLYSFTCDYPGIRHGGKPGSVEGKVEMRDMLALCILFTGFTPYLTDRLDAAALFQGR